MFGVRKAIEHIRNNLNSQVSNNDKNPRERSKSLQSESSHIKPIYKTSNLFNRKIKAMFPVKNKPINTDIIKASNTIAISANDGLEFKAGIHKQKAGTVVCGIANNLNITENAFRNSIKYLLYAIKKFEIKFTSHPDSTKELIDSIENITKTYKEFYLGNEDLEDEMIVLQSLLYEYNTIEHANTGRYSSIREEINISTQSIAEKLNLLLTSNRPNFNAEDVIYSSLSKIKKHDDESSKNEFVEIANSLERHKENNQLCNANESPVDLFNIVRGVSENSNMFDDIAQYSVKNERGIEYIEQNKFSLLFAYRIDIIIHMMKNYSNIESHHSKDLIYQMIQYLQLDENIEMINTLSESLNINYANKTEQINAIAEQALDFFNRIKGYGFISREKTHFNSIVYSAIDNEFKLLNSTQSDDADIINSTENVIEYLEQSKNRNHTFSVTKRDVSDTFIYKLNSNHEQYYQQ